jgi:hypothetical protein
MIAEDEIIPHAGVRIGIQVTSAVAYIHARGFLHGAVTSENISLLTDSIDAPFAKLTGLDTARRIDETLASHPGIDVYAVGALLVQMLARNKREPPLRLPIYEPITKSCMSGNIELRPSATDLLRLLEAAFEKDDTDPDTLANELVMRL